ncbi:MAG TPA: hypothetical protein GX694_03735 [Actinomycetales bacterium]|nr:hypothetical protein [Actinomycetales bacterium]
MTVAPGVGGLACADEPTGTAGGRIWCAPSGTTARLEVDGDPESAPDLLWSARCAEIPATRAVVLLAGEGFDDVSAGFEHAHRAAEAAADLLTTEVAAVGPVEVLVFRPDAEAGPWPEPAATDTGAEFRFRHRGGATVHLTLTIPTDPGGA